MASCILETFNTTSIRQRKDIAARREDCVPTIMSKMPLLNTAAVITEQNGKGKKHTFIHSV